MPYHAINRTLALGDQTMDSIAFGRGPRAMVILPGLGDGLRTVKGSAFPFSVMYRAYAKRYRVYVFSRANELCPGSTTEEMARDVALAMDKLKLTSAAVMGVSQGGMIAQCLALERPDLVDKLALVVTLARPNPVMNGVVSAWIAMARKGAYRQLMLDTFEKSYSETYLRSRRWLFPLLTLTGKPKDMSRFIIEAESCLRHDTFARLPAIACPTLVIGGAEDKIVGAQASKEIAAQIKDSELYLYPGLGHALYEEAKDFHERVLAFFARAGA